MTGSARRKLADTLGNHDFRLYAGAQFLHATGMWVHRVAELWLVYQITGSTLAVGVATAARAGSSIVLAPLAGTLADRVDRRVLLASTQFTKALTAAGLAVVTVSMGTEVPLVLLYGVIMTLGVIGAIDTPLRRAFVRDVVTAEGLDGAARLHTSVMSAGRIVGSGLAALALSAPWACFAGNGVASLTASVLVLRVRPTTSVSPAARAAGGRLFGYLRRSPTVTIPMALLCCFALFGWNLEVLVPVLVDEQLGTGPAAFGMLVMVMSLGSLVGSVAVASRDSAGLGRLVALLAVFGAAIVALAAVQHVADALVAFFLVGACGGGFLSLANSSVQTAADPRLQGRVAAVYGVVFVGSRALGGPLLGWMVDTIGSRAALAAVGLGTVGFAALGVVVVRRARRDSNPQPSDP